jgi:ubiquinone/menaquinone biosynthesis C-methylase UbiE
MTNDAGLPAYEPMLAAYHRAFASELRSIVGSLPITEGHAVLDMACGDGAYSPWLADRVGVEGRVVAVDKSPKYLEIARKGRTTSSFPDSIEVLCATIYSLPFEDEAFDLCWCAHSLYSLPDPVKSLMAMLRVTKPGGVVAVLESDTFHHVILPWPVEIELSVRAAELQFLVEDSQKPRKFYVGRRLRSVLRKAGLKDIVIRTVAHDRSTPLGPDELAYFTEYLKDLSTKLTNRLDGGARRKFESLVDSQSDEFLLSDPDLTVTCIDQLAWGRTPL